MRQVRVVSMTSRYQALERTDRDKERALGVSQSLGDQPPRNHVWEEQK
jgi:hypothetical protein